MHRKVPAVLAASVVVLVSCTGRVREASEPLSPSPVPSRSSDVATGQARITDPASLATAIADAGFTVEATDGPTGIPWREIAGVPHGFRIGDNENLTVFEYPSAQALTKMKARIKPRGDLLPTDDGGIVLINWSHPPSLFTYGRLLALYFGDDPAVASTLADLLGKPR
jgi:hypothetical protein